MMNAKYRGYSEYKCLSSIFLTEIPTSWDVRPLYALCEFRQGKAHEPYVDDLGEFICVNARFVSTQGESIKLCNVNLTPANIHDILMVMSDLPNGRALAKAFFVKDKRSYAVNQRVCAITAHAVDPKFIFYQLDRSPYFLMYDDGSNQTHLSNDSYKKYPVLVPSQNEQKNIARFLDYETAKIDALIEKQQQLIALLKEKRQAVISHAVTKGLNSNARMKDSGVEWLGEVPEHWGVIRFKFLCDQIISGPFGSSITKDMYVKEGYKVYGQEQVIPNDFSIGDYYVAERTYVELSRYIVNPGDILISCVGTFGKVAVFPKDAEQGIINPRLIKAQTNSNSYSYYLREILKSEIVFKQFELLSRGGTMGVINIAVLNEIVVPVPPLNEQKVIFDYIKEQENKFNYLIECAHRQIELSQERRTALISAAVTGKIDVRDWVAPKQSTEEAA